MTPLSWSTQICLKPPSFLSFLTLLYVLLLPTYLSDSSIIRFDLCNGIEYDSTSFQITSPLHTSTANQIVFYICAYDQNKNPKSFTGDYSNIISIDYPSHILPDTSVQIEPYDSLNKVFIISVPISSHGDYTIFCDKFFKNSVRHYTISQVIDSEHSLLFIANHIKQTERNSKVTLLMKLIDQFGDEINSDSLISKFQCNFSQSRILHTKSNVETTYDIGASYSAMENGFLSLNYVPSEIGKYVFVPKLTCSNTNINKVLALTCSECTFYVRSSDIDSNVIKLHSDFTEQSYLSTELQDNNVLYISLDESDNNKLTTVSFVDLSGMDTQLNDIDVTHDKVSAVLTDKADNAFQIDLQTVLTNVGFIDLYLPNHVSRNSTFLPLKSYLLSINIESTSFNHQFAEIPIMFISRNNYYNNLDASLTSSNEFITANLLPSKTLHADNVVPLCQIFSVNTNNGKGSTSLVNNSLLTCSNIELTTAVNANETEVAYECTEFYLHLHISLSIQTEGEYSVSIRYKSADTSEHIDLGKMEFTVVAQLNIENIEVMQTYPAVQQGDSSLSTITLSPNNDEHLITGVIKMKDKYNNTIKGEDALTVYNSIEITENGITNELGLDGLIYIKGSYTKGMQSIVFKLKNKQTKTVQCERTYYKLDPSLSNAKVIYDNTNGIKVGQQIQIALRLRDTTGKAVLFTESEYTSQIHQHINIYAVHNNYNTRASPYHEFTYQRIEAADSGEINIIYAQTLTTTGEYTVKVFYDNKLIQCYGSVITVLPSTADDSYTEMYYLYNNMKLRVPNEIISKAAHSENDNRNAGTEHRQIAFKSTPFVVVIEHKDEHGNVITSLSTTYSLKLTPLNGEKKSLSLCAMSPLEGFKYIYQVCGGSIIPETYEDGEYYIAVKSKRFYFYITSAELAYNTDNTYNTPSDKSMLVIESSSNYIYAKNDIPTQIVIDVRNANNLRLSGFDLSNMKVYLNNTDANAAIAYGPSKGFVTVFIQHQHVGAYTLDVRYNEEVIIGNYVYVNKPGMPLHINALQPHTTYAGMKANYISFELKDAHGNACDNGYNELVNMVEFLVQRENTYIAYEKQYNEMKGVLTLKVEDFISGSLQIESAYFSYSGNVVIQQMSSDIDNLKMYLNGVSTDDDGNHNVNGYVVIYDKMYNEIQLSTEWVDFGDFALRAFKVEHEHADVISEISANDISYRFNIANSRIQIDINTTQSGAIQLVPYYKNMKYHCDNCLITISNEKDAGDIKGDVYIKKGPYNWVHSPLLVYTVIQKEMLPLFKVILHDNHGNAIYDKLTLEQYDFAFVSSEDVSLALAKVVTDNEVYLYLTPQGKKEYLGLSNINVFTLNVINKNERIPLAKFVFFNSHNELIPLTQCNEDAKPVVLDSGIRSHKAGSAFIVEFKLEGCESQVKNYLYDGFSLHSQDEHDFTLKHFIPSDIRGYYMLLLQSDKMFINSEFTIQYNSSEPSDNLVISVTPSYSIGSVEFVTNDNEVFFVNNAYAYFEFALKDVYGNAIGNEDRNAFVNDINVDVMFNGNLQLPIKLSYNNSNTFIGQIPLKHSGTITITIHGASLHLVVEDDMSFMHSYIHLQQQSDSTFTSTINLKDSKYQAYGDNGVSWNELAFRYTSYDIISNEIFNCDAINVKANDNGGFDFELPNGVDKAQFHTITPRYKNSNAICKGCFIVNTSAPSKYYRVINSEYYLSTNIESIASIEHYVEYPVILYYSLTGNQLHLDNKAVSAVLSNNTHIIAAYNESNQLNSVNEQTLLTLSPENNVSIKLRLNSDDDTSSSNEIAIGNTEIISNTIKRYIVGEVQSIYVDLRDNNNKLTSTPATISLSNYSDNIIEVPTSLRGRYLLLFYNKGLTPSSPGIAVTVSNRPTGIALSVFAKANTPSSLAIDSIETDQNEIRINVFCKDINNNFICDDRINPYFDFNKSAIEYTIHPDQSGTHCVIQLPQHKGDVTLTVPAFDKEISQHISNHNVVANVNVFVYEITMLPRVITSDDTDISLHVYQKQHTNVEYVNITDISVCVYTHLSFTKRILLSTTSIAYNNNNNTFITLPTSINITTQLKPSHYILTPFINGIALQQSIPFSYQHSYDLTAAKFKPTLITSNIHADITSHIVASISSINPSNSVTLQYPYTIHLQITNAVGVCVPYASSIHPKAYLISKSSEEVSYEYDVQRISEYTYAVHFYYENYQDYLHLSKGDYVLYMTYSSIKNYINVNFNDGLFQYTLISNKYQHITDPFPLDSFDVVSENKNLHIVTHEKSFVHTMLCIVNASNDNKVYNNYLNISDISFDNGSLASPSCAYQLTITHRGCFDMYIKCDRTASAYKSKVYYNSVGSASEITVQVNPACPPIATVVQEFPSQINTNNDAETKFTLANKDGEAFSYVDYDNFKIYVNYKLLDIEKDVNVFVSENQYTIIIYNKVFTYPPQAHHVEVYFAYGNNEAVNLNLTKDITVQQETYKKVMMYVPVGYKAGDGLYMYLLLKDNNGFCYDDDNASLLSEFSVSVVSDTAPSSTYSEFKLEFAEIANVYKCKRVIKITPASFTPFTTVGAYTITTYTNTTSVQTVSTLYIYPNELSQAHSTLQAVGSEITSTISIKADIPLEIKLTGTDEYSNTIDFFNLAERFSFTISPGIASSNYTTAITPSETSSSLLLTLTVKEIGTYRLELYIDDAPFTCAHGLNTVIVGPGNCSALNPSYMITPRGDDAVYPGESVEVEIRCRDKIGNAINTKGNEEFVITVNGTELDVVKSDYIETTPVFVSENSNGVYKARFTLVYSGQYVVNIKLNGEMYGKDSLTVMHAVCNEGTFMCKNKTCVNNAIDCDVSYVEAKERCSGEDKKVFECKVNGETVCVDVTELSKCDCDDGYEKCNGMCLPNEYNYCQSDSNSNITHVNCSEYGLVTCNDGSCRHHITMCADNKMTCPLGYVPCGATCVQYGTTCDLINTLNNDDNSHIYCWDLSRVTTYDKCPTRKTCSNADEYLCPNGNCVENEYECMQPPKCENGYVLCDDMLTCKPNINDCPSKPVCAQGFALCTNNECKADCNEATACTGGKVMCANGECVANLQMCSSEMYCPEHYVRCSQGGCAVNAEQCKYIQGNSIITCPLDKPVLCPDLNCVSNSDMCVITSTTLCPPYAPYQCWNNECRTSFDLCPTKTTCPSLFPVLCVNGFCVKGPHQCVSNDDPLPTTANSVRCGDGTYASSILLCPTHVTCPNGKVRCWNSACVDSVSECRAPDDASSQVCTHDKPYRCFDGSCAETKQHCPLISTCPIERPVKCYDGSCRYDFNECPNYHSCGMNMVNCPGGMCAKSYDKCPSLPVCSSSLAPYACSDSRCVSDLRDCYEPPECEGKILCPNGLCVTNRQNCKPSSSSLVRCWNGEWKVSLAYCEPFTCPINFPHKCVEGTCVTDAKYCDYPETSCPYNKPIKCPDGNCASRESECTSTEEASELCIDKHLCPDGSCHTNPQQCPLINGCQPDKPLRCADGTCINPKKSECTPPLCEETMPIRCANGQCATSIAECSLATKVKERNGCDDGMFLCADGRCVVSSEMCRALYVCGSNYVKCGDGSCRVTYELCPRNAKLCPGTMCGNGECVESEEMCGRKCPKGYSKCPTTGMCMKSENMGVACPEEPQYKSGCDDDSKVKCVHDGRCMSDYTKCVNVNSACQEDTPYLCADGKCAVDKSQCSSNTQCGFGETRCPINGECVEYGYEHTCTNDIGCPIHTPIRCANGRCVKMYSECKATISCEGDKPYLCADGSCVKDYRFCNVDYPCTEEGMVKCNNGYCVADAEQCDNESDLCPISSHIKCLNGKCVKHREECSESFSTEQCAEGTLFCTRLARCVRNVAECIGEDAVRGSVNSKRHRRGSMLANAKDDEDDVVIENACNEETPYSCYDGTCVSDRTQCPILPACKPMQYRCPDGTCQYSLDKCSDAPTCEDSLHLCEDGLCRLHCPSYNGCSLNQFQCTNGMCVESELECIGYSMCPDPASPYRCIDNKCVSNPSTCADIKRLHSIEPVTSSFTVHDSFSLSFSFDSASKPVGSLSIPSNSIKHRSASKTQGSIHITGIAHSLLCSQDLYNNTVEFLHNVSNGIVSSDGVLSFENAVLSPVVNIHSSSIESTLNINAILHLEHNVYAYNNGEESFAPGDYCLSKLISSPLNETNYTEWQCVSRCESYDQREFAIDSLGIYAIVLNPLRNVTSHSDKESKNFFLDNIKVLAIVLGVVVLGSGVVFYVFSRVIRYREKYHASKKKEQLLIQQRQEYEMMSTDVFGQTLGDNILGLVYKQNCIFSLSQGEVEEIGNIGLENDVEELQRQCVNVERQNKRLENMIAGINEDYKKLVFEINEMKG